MAIDIKVDLYVCNEFSVERSERLTENIFAAINGSSFDEAGSAVINALAYIIMMHPSCETCLDCIDQMRKLPAMMEAQFYGEFAKVKEGRQP